MEVILDSIFGNILIILAVVAGIVGFFKDRSNKETEQNNPYTASEPGSTPTGSGNRSDYDRPTNEDERYSTTSDDQSDTSTRHETANREHDALRQKRAAVQSRSSDNNKQLKKQISSNLSKQGLVNGVIMSEVLGAPRAKKPYRSLNSERRR